MEEIFQEFLQSDAGRTLNPRLLAAHLYKRGLLCSDEFSIINSEEMPTAGRTKLFFDILPSKDKERTMQCLIETAAEINCEPMRDFFEMRKNHVSSKNHLNQLAITKSALDKLVSALKQKYIKDCEIMRNHWNHFLDFGDEYAMNTFIQLEIIDEGTRMNTPLTAHTYEEIFLCPPGSRIVLEGNPGMGKTTFLHKIALDWAKDDVWLNHHFDLVLIVRLGEVKSKVSLFEAVAEYLTPSVKNILQQIIMNESLLNEKTLLLLDGYDEFYAKNDCPELKELTQGQRNLSAFLLISTRPSRTAELIPRNRLLRTNGFSSDKLQTLIKNDSQLSKFLLNNQLDENFLKNPLVFGMYKAVQHTENTELFTLMETFCNHLFLRHFKLKPGDQIDETHKDTLFQFISQVAYHFHSEQSQSFTYNHNLLTDAARIGLLWHHRKARGLDRSIPETEELDPTNWSFPHKLFQDFFAARFAHRELSFEDIKTANYDNTFRYFYSGFSSKFRQYLFDVSFGTSNKWDQATLHCIANPESIDASYVTNKMASFNELEILGHGKPISDFFNVIVDKISRIMEEKEQTLYLLVLNTCLFQDWRILIKLPAERLLIIDERIWDVKANQSIAAPLSRALTEFKCYGALSFAEFRGPFVQFVITHCNELPELQELTLWTNNNDPFTTTYASDISCLITWVKRNQRLKKLKISVDIRVAVTDFSHFINALSRRNVILQLDRLSRHELINAYRQFLDQRMKARIKWNELDIFQRTMEMQEMKLYISKKAAQDTQESKDYINSFILYGTDNNGDFMEFYPSEEQKRAQCNPEYKFYFGNLRPPVREWPRGEGEDLEGIHIALLPGAERYRMTAEVDGQKMTLLYPQLTWDIVQAIKSKLEYALATVYVLRDEKVDPFTRDRTTATYFGQKVESVEAFIVIGVHFNVGHPNNANADSYDEEGATFELQRANDICAYVPGSYMKQYSELAKEQDRFIFLRDIVTRKTEESVQLADCIVRALRNKLALPPRPLTTNAARLATEGVYFRNLGYIRHSKCPVCYCSTACIDDANQFKKLVTGNIQDIVDGYYEGIMNYIARKRDNYLDFIPK